MNVFELFAKLKLDKSDYEKGLNEAGKLAKTGMTKIAKVGIAATAAATGASVAFAKSAVDTGKQFDASMSQVAATMGKTMAEMENEVGSVDLAWGKFSGNLSEYAQEMGANTAFSATQAADALNYMALAGYDAQTSMQMLPNVLNLAAAGSMELATASDMITDTQTAFGISLERTTQMVDEMAKAASTGNTSVEQLGNAFLTVGGLASELNGGMVKLDDGTEVAVDGIQELEIALTAMANAGVKGNEAGTHMRNMLLKLSSPSSDGAKALEEMGVKVFDASGKMRSLSDIFGDLNDQLSTMTQEQKIQTISDLFNTRDLASAEALLNAVGEDWDNIGASILEAQGSAQKMADTQLDNLAGDMTLFQSALDGAKITVSNKLTPSLRKFVQFGTNGLTKLTDAYKKGGLDGAMNAMGKILSDGLNMIVKDLPKFVNAGMKLLKALGQGIMDNMPVIIESAITIMGYLFRGLIEALPSLLEAALQIILTLAEDLQESLPEMIPAIIDVILKIVEILTEPDTLSMLIEASIAIIIALADGLIDAMPRLIDAVPVLITNIVVTIGRNLPKIMAAGLTITVKVIEGLLKGIPQLLSKAPQIVLSIIQGIVEYFGSVIETGSEIVSKVKDGFMEKVEAAKQWGKDLISNFISGLKSKLEDLKDSVKGIAGTIKDYLGFSEPEDGPLSNFHTFAPDMMDLFASGITDNMGTITDAVSKAFDLKSMIVNPNNIGQMSVAGAGGDIVIPVYIGQERIDEIIVASEQTRNYRSGGR